MSKERKKYEISRNINNNNNRINDLKVDDKVKIMLSVNDYDYQKWDAFESKIIEIVNLGWNEPQYERMEFLLNAFILRSGVKFRSEKY